MKCYNCGYEADNSNTCPGCGRDLRVYKRIQVASALCYNEGLRKARVRDLSGAIDELTKALKYNKYNIDARNLLGLVYFEIGEPVNAMGEWVISKNLKPEDNLADGYLSYLQGDPGMINRMDEATKKYNQAVGYIRQGDYDLAKIQLKRLVSKNPGMLRARSLLALMYLMAGEPRAAKKELAAAGKIDVGNPTINTYFQEVKEGIKSELNPGRRRRRDVDITEESVVNENVTRFNYIMDYSKVSVVNIIIGAIIGLLVSIFLIFPAIKQSTNNDTMTALITANEESRSNQNDISAMEQTIEGLSSRLEQYEGRSDVKESYENLVAALSAANAGDMESASVYYEKVTKSTLDKKGQESYDGLSLLVDDFITAKHYDDAMAFIADDNTDSAIIALTQVINAKEDYDEGNALYSLAKVYEDVGDNENAIKYYTRLTELYGGRRLGNRAKERLRVLNGETSSAPVRTESAPTAEPEPAESAVDPAIPEPGEVIGGEEELGN